MHSLERSRRPSRRDLLRRGVAVSTAVALGLVAGTGRAAGMNKAELIDSIASESDITEADAKKGLDAFIDTTTKALKKGNRVALVGFGTLSPSPAPRARKPNPQRGTVWFSPSDGFVEALETVGKKKKNRTRSGRPRDEPTEEGRLDAARLLAELDGGSKESGFDDRTAKAWLDAFPDAVARGLNADRRVDIGDFGSFSVPPRSARKGRTPQTGKEIKIPTKKVVKFKPGAELAEKIT